MPLKRVMGSLATASCLLIVSGCQTPSSTDNPQSGLYRAEIIRTSHGVAHITADDYPSLGYGEGYAAAQDHVCNIARSIVAARGELALTFGAGEKNRNIIEDGVVKALDTAAQARQALAQQDTEMRAWLTGYAAGYNRHVRERAIGGDTSWCAGAPWVDEISALDLMARMVLVAQTLPRMAGALAAAQPPGEQSAVRHVDDALVASAKDAIGLSGMGSNAWALGNERTENGHGLLLANPHYPWYGSSRFWEKHLTIPGRLNVYGVQLLGAPGVSIGFTDNVAWTHTVSDSERVVFYKLKLAPGDPTSYLYDGKARKMSERPVAVPVLQDDGSIEENVRTFYFTHLGPVLALPGMGWTDSTAFAARDANAGNYRLLAQWKAMNLADDLDAFIGAHRRWNALPWVNTMAASRDGRALYLDNSTVGNLSARAIELWQQSLDSDALAAQVYRENGMILLDGSDSRFAWVDDATAPLRGTVPFTRRPQLERRDYIFNANDSYWLTNAQHPLTGYSPLYGPEATARSLRTRMNARLLAADSDYGYAGDDGRFSLSEVQAALFSNRSLAAELLAADLVAACQRTPQITLDDEVVDLTAACAALAGFNGRMDEDSAGAILFREWLGNYRYADTLAAGALFAEPFSADTPVTTPRTLANSGLALENLARAAHVLAAAALPLDAPLGMAQFAYRADRRIAVHGGNRAEGVANLQISGVPDHPIAAIDSTPVGGSSLLMNAGYPIIHGSSFILTLAFSDQGPVAEALMSYSQSGDPGSPWFADQTELYRQKTFRPVRFRRADIENDVFSRELLTGGATR